MANDIAGGTPSAAPPAAPSTAPAAAPSTSPPSTASTDELAQLAQTEDISLYVEQRNEDSDPNAAESEPHRVYTRAERRRRQMARIKAENEQIEPLRKENEALRAARGETEQQGTSEAAAPEQYDGAQEGEPGEQAGEQPQTHDEIAKQVEGAYRELSAAHRARVQMCVMQHPELQEILARAPQVEIPPDLEVDIMSR
jgi:hypothetical protein